tara:strand:+ start:2628 stop:3863 length:1236 start_codon:yes stop_codon:yes gene_type:complete
MNLLVLSDNFPPESNAPAVRTFEHSKILVNKSMNVTVITCNPNFPNGKIHKGYKNSFFTKEVLEGINVIRVWTFLAENKGFFLRIFDQMSFLFSSFFASFRVNKTDIIFATSPQFFCALAGYIISKIKGKPWILEIRDLYPESLLAVGLIRESSLIYKLLKKIEIGLYKDANHIITVTESFKEEMIKQGINPNKISVLLNGIDKEFKSKCKDPVDKFNLGYNKDDFIVGYIGTIGMSHSIETIVKAAKLFEKEEEFKNLKFLLMGSGAQKKYISKLIDESKCSNISLYDSVPREDVPSYLSILNLSIIHLKKSDSFKKVIPSKIFESIAAEVPILHGVEGESANIVNKYCLGETFEPENHKDLFKKIKSLRADKSKLQNFKTNCKMNSKIFERSAIVSELESIINKVVNEK